MAGYTIPYTIIEENRILRYIIEKEGYFFLRGDAFWKAMETSKITNRTWQSLKQHFKKQMAPRLTTIYYNIPRKQLKKIHRAYMATACIKPKLYDSKEPRDEPTASEDSEDSA